MKLSVASAALVASLVIGTLPAAAADGVRVSQRMTTGGAPRTTDIQIEKTRMRTEIAGPSGTQVVIFDGAKQVLYLIDTAKKTYSEITKADAERIGAQVQGMMAQMQSQMAAMPPQARAQMEAAMRGRGMGAPIKTEYRRNGTDRVASWTCDKYDGYQNNQKTSEICTVAPSALGLVVADFEVTRQFADFFSALVPQMSQQISAIGTPEAQGFSGLPVKTVIMTGPTQTTVEVTAIARETFADALFALPAGFTKQEFLGGLAGR